MTFEKVVPIRNILDNYDLILFDLWGVIVEGNATYHGVVNTINEIMTHKEVRFVSNSPRLRSEITERMKRFGLNASEGQYFTSGQMTQDLLYSPGAENRVIYYLSHGNDYNLLHSAIQSTSDLTKATTFLCAAHLAEDEDLDMFNDLFAEAIKLKLPCICPNPDTIIPDQGKKRYCPGYFAGIYEKMGGAVTYIGKPGVDIFLSAIRSCLPQPPLDRVLMIGDTMDMDILGANKAGIHSGLVMTGNVERVLSSMHSADQKLQLLRDMCARQGIAPTMLIDLR